MRTSAQFKKLKVVDEQDLLRMIEKQLRQYDPALHAMARMKRDMDSTFMREDLSPEEKLTLLKVNQQRFSQMKSGVSSAIKAEPEIAPSITNESLDRIEPPVDEDNDDEEFHDLTSSPLHQSDSVSSFQNEQEIEASSSAGKVDPREFYPKPEAKHAERFANFEKLLQGSGNYLKPNPANGELMIAGKSISGSSFHDLVNSIFVSSRNANLVGQAQFLETIRNLSQNEINGWPSLIDLSKLIPRTSIVKGLKNEMLSPKTARNPVFTRAESAKNIAKKGKGKGRFIFKRNGIQGGPPGKRIKVMYLY